MTGFENHAGFTITDSKLQVVEVIYNDSQFILENVDEAYFNEQINFERDKETKISALLQGAFDEIQIKKLLKSTSVSFTLPFDLFYIMQIPFDNTLLHQDLIEEFRWELSLLYPFLNLRDLVIQFLEIDKSEYSNVNTALILATQRKYLKMLNEICINNKFKLKFVDNVHIASEKSLSINNNFNDKNLTLSVYFNSKNLSVLFALHGKLIYYKLIPINSVREISDHFKK